MYRIIKTPLGYKVERKIEYTCFFKKHTKWVWLNIMGGYSAMGLPGCFFETKKKAKKFIQEDKTEDIEYIN